jgi:hypothetical protein
MVSVSLHNSTLWQPNVVVLVERLGNRLDGVGLLWKRKNKDLEGKGPLPG